ncbi:hypothetical protein HZA38_04110 [Candidatus Peregrinibacteria bacterium]|nr:hypothetical protein [Candidatus Peregrinibacteria bacterium]
MSKKFFLLFFFGNLLFAFFLFGESDRIFDEQFHFKTYDIPLGDAILMKTPHGKFVTIDGGDDSTFVSKLSQDLPFWNREIELMVVTHPEKDHFVGALESLKVYSVKNVFLTGANGKTSEFREFLSLLSEKDIPVFFSDSEKDFWIDGVFFDIFSPEKPLMGKEIQKMNNSGIVLRVTFEDQSILLTADIEADGEKEILKKPVPLKSDILKVAHHGSKTSSSPEFLEAVQPKISVISAGKKNPYGHPHAEIVDRIKNFGSGVLVTKDVGDIEFTLE